MLALTKRVDYALIALCHLANHREQTASAREIADRYHVPLSLLMSVLKQLSRNGLVQSSRGARGGYELARSPELVTLNELIEVLEGPVRFVQCAALDGSPTYADGSSPATGGCVLFDVCPVSAPVRRLHRKLKAFLKDITLAEIAFDPEYGQVSICSGVEVTVAGRETTI